MEVLAFIERFFPVIVAGIISILTWFYTSRRTAKKEDLQTLRDLYSERVVEVEKLKAEMQEMRTCFYKEVADLRVKLNTELVYLSELLRYIGRLQHLMEQANIKVPPMPERHELTPDKPETKGVQ